jgi:hypothetical protein
MVAAMYARMEATGNQSPDGEFDWGSLMPAPGRYRTSLIAEPTDGKRPLNQAAQDLDKVLKDRTDKAEGPEARGRLNAIARQLNERSRKTPDYQSPAERIGERVAAIN